MFDRVIASTVKCLTAILFTFSVYSFSVFCRFCVVNRLFIPATTANDLRLWRIFYPRFYPLHLFSYLNSWERASISLFQRWVLNKGTTGTIFITSLVWRCPWLGIESGRPAREASTLPLCYRGGGISVYDFEGRISRDCNLTIHWNKTKWFDTALLTPWLRSKLLPEFRNPDLSESSSTRTFFSSFSRPCFSSNQLWISILSCCTCPCACNLSFSNCNKTKGVEW